MRATAQPLAFDRVGTGPVALLLHGVGGGRAAWGDELSGTARALAEAGWQAIAVDLPGYGDSSPIDPYDMAGLAAAVAATLEAVGGARAVLVGHSMGGMVAQEVAARHPERVRALALTCTSPAFGRPGGDFQRRFLADRLAPLDAGGGMAALAPGLARGMASPDAPPDAVARAAAMMARVPEATYRAALHAIVGFDRRADLARIAVPTLCMTGSLDRNAPPQVMQPMAERIPGAVYVELPGVGHLGNMEAPQAYNAALVDFLARHVAAEPALLERADG